MDERYYLVFSFGRSNSKYSRIEAEHPRLLRKTLQILNATTRNGFNMRITKKIEWQLKWCIRCWFYNSIIKINHGSFYYFVCTLHYHNRHSLLCVRILITPTKSPFSKSMHANVYIKPWKIAFPLSSMAGYYNDIKSVKVSFTRCSIVPQA